MQFDIEAPLNLHRSIFGDARMDATADDPDEPDDSVDEPDDADEPDDDAAAKAADDALGDAGKQALDRMKAQRNAERQKRREVEAKLAEATKPKADDGGKPDLDALRNEAREEARAEQLKERALDKIEAKAARLFKDPEDAVLRLGRNIDDFIDDGKVDTEAIGEALDELLKTRPDFALAQSDRPRFGDADAGPRGKPATGKPQLTEADVDRLSAEGKHAEVEKARLEGRLNDLLGIKT